MHDSCRGCKHVFFERSESGACPDCGAELVSSETRGSGTGSIERDVAGRQKLMTLMGEDFLADALVRRKESAPPTEEGAPAGAVVGEKGSVPPTEEGVPAGVVVGEKGSAPPTGEDFLTGALMQAKAPAPLAQTAADLTSAGPVAAEPVSARPTTGKLTSAGPVPSAAAPTRHFSGAKTPRVALPRPPAVAGTSRERVFGVAGIVVLGAATGILAVILLVRSPDDAVVADAQARMAGLEKRLADLETGSVALKKENSALSVANREFGAEKGTLEQQIGDLRENVRKQAEARRLTLGAVALLERRSNLDRALEMADAALALGPGPLAAADASRVKGRVLAVAGRPGEALAAFEAAHDAATKAGEVVGDAEALVLAGEVCLTDISDRDRALGYYRKAAELGAGSARRSGPSRGADGAAFGLIAEARTLLLGGDWDGTVSKAMRARKADPSLALAPLVVGEAVFSQALEKSGAEKGALLKEADPFLVEAIKLDPNSAHACFVRGRLLIEQTRLISSERGFGLARFGRQDEAARLLQKAKDLSPSRPEAYLALGKLRLEKGALRNPGLARTFAEQAVELTGRKDAGALATLASALAASGSPAEAAKTMAEALEVGPGNDEMRSLLARYKAEAEATSP